MAKVVKPNFGNSKITSTDGKYDYKENISNLNVLNNMVNNNNTNYNYAGENKDININGDKTPIDMRPNKGVGIFDGINNPPEIVKPASSSSGSDLTAAQRVKKIFSLIKDNFKETVGEVKETVEGGIYSVLNKLGIANNDKHKENELPLQDYSPKEETTTEETITEPIEAPTEVAGTTDGVTETTTNETTEPESTTDPNSFEIPSSGGGGETSPSEERIKKGQDKVEPKLEDYKKSTGPVGTTPTEGEIKKSASPTQSIPQMENYTVTCYEEDGWHLNYSPNPRGVASGTLQKEVHNKFKEDGARYQEGIAVLNVDGEDRFLVAVTPKYGKPGDKIDVCLEDGTILKCVIADEKGDDAGHVDGHYEKGQLSVVEMEVDTQYALDRGKDNPGGDRWPLSWDNTSPVVRIDNYGSIL